MDDKMLEAADKLHSQVLVVVMTLVALDPAADTTLGTALAQLSKAVGEYENERWPMGHFEDDTP